MTAHDDAIEAAGRYVLLHSPLSWIDARIFGAAIVDEVEPLIRADERERNREAEGVESYLAMEHAEAVAARLVEVICEQEAEWVEVRAVADMWAKESAAWERLAWTEREARSYFEAEAVTIAARIARGES